MMEKPDDIYWLTKDEAAQAAARLDVGEALRSRWAQSLLQRKAAWRRCQAGDAAHDAAANENLREWIYPN